MRLYSSHRTNNQYWAPCASMGPLFFEAVGAVFALICLHQTSCAAWTALEDLPTRTVISSYETTHTEREAIKTEVSGPAVFQAQLATDGEELHLQVQQSRQCVHHIHATQIQTQHLGYETNWAWNGPVAGLGALVASSGVLTLLNAPNNPSIFNSPTAGQWSAEGSYTFGSILTGLGVSALIHSFWTALKPQGTKVHKIPLTVPAKIWDCGMVPMTGPLYVSPIGGYKPASRLPVEDSGSRTAMPAASQTEATNPSPSTSEVGVSTPGPSEGQVFLQSGQEGIRATLDSEGTAEIQLPASWAQTRRPHVPWLNLNLPNKHDYVLWGNGSIRDIEWVARDASISVPDFPEPEKVFKHGSAADKATRSYLFYDGPTIGVLRQDVHQSYAVSSEQVPTQSSAYIRMQQLIADKKKSLADQSFYVRLPLSVNYYSRKYKELVLDLGTNTFTSAQVAHPPGPAEGLEFKNIVLRSRPIDRNRPSGALLYRIGIKIPDAIAKVLVQKQKDVDVYIVFKAGAFKKQTFQYFVVGDRSPQNSIADMMITQALEMIWVDRKSENVVYRHALEMVPEPAEVPTEQTVSPAPNTSEQ